MFRISRLLRYGMPQNSEQASAIMLGIVGMLIVLMIVQRLCDLIVGWIV